MIVLLGVLLAVAAPQPTTAPFDLHGQTEVVVPGLADKSIFTFGLNALAPVKVRFEYGESGSCHTNTVVLLSPNAWFKKLAWQLPLVVPMGDSLCLSGYGKGFVKYEQF